MNSAFASLRPTPSPQGSGRSTPASVHRMGAPSPRPPPSRPAQDSFSNLMNFGPAKSAQNLSLAERQAQLEAEKRKKEEERSKQTEAQFGNAQFWDTLGSRGATPNPSVQQAAAANGAQNDDDDLFAAFNRDTKVDKSSYYPPPESHRSTPQNGAPVDLRDPTAWGSTTGARASGREMEDDDDPFGLNEMKTSSAAAPSQAAAADDDDFLGDLGRPVHEVRSNGKAAEREPGKPIEDEDESSTSSSEEERQAMERQAMERRPKVNKDPHDIAVAQLVDYGFSAEDARRGLVESGSGYNAQEAVNWLLDEAHRKSKEAAQGKTAPAASRPTPPPRDDSRSPGTADNDLAKSAASVGSSLFKTANSLWKTSQKRMQQAVADFQQPDGDSSQPKWMRNAQQGQAEPSPRASDMATDEAMMLDSGRRPQTTHSKSRDTTDFRQQAPSQPARRPSPAQAPVGRSSPLPRRQQQSAPPAMFDARSRLNRLGADDDTFSTNVSANRRKKPTPAPEPKKTEPEEDLLFNSQAPKASQSLPQRPATSSTLPQAKRSAPRPTPSPRPARQIPSISTTTLQDSTKHRLAGTAHFKRGDFASAQASYSSSLADVPSTHPLMIVLLTNRALTLLKTGEPKQAVADADNALQIIGAGNGHGETVAVQAETGQEEQRDMKELYGKALSRKAEALEHMEKWRDAALVWQQCVESGVGGASAIKGRQRCQEALAPKPKAVPKPAAPRPKPSAAASLAPQKESEAVTRLREANQAAVREDDEKFALGDKIDERVSAWRDGKRDNLRGLLASLDQVLWENSGWKKVGMHELVVANKVKIVYMKAIAKTHPDKVSFAPAVRWLW